MRDSELIMPLNNKLALFARFEGSGGVFAANKETVAALNSGTASQAGRFLYSSQKDFFWLTKNGTISNKSGLIAMIKEAVPQKDNITSEFS